MGGQGALQLRLDLKLSVSGGGSRSALYYVDLTRGELRYVLAPARALLTPLGPGSPARSSHFCLVQSSSRLTLWLSLLPAEPGPVSHRLPAVPISGPPSVWPVVPCSELWGGRRGRSTGGRDE